MTAVAPSSAPLPRPGDMIGGKYVLERLLGQGGMGAVFAARHVKLGNPVAIKIMLADATSPEALNRFVNEGRAAANIDDDHVVKVRDVDEELGYAYMVLELLEGEDLSQLLAAQPSRRLAPNVAVGFVLQAVAGVAQAHAIGIVHRDLKPSNLFVARRKDGSTIIKVLDFGISKAQGSSALAASPNALTSTKAMLGSPLYMSPEQLRSSRSVDHRADIWALGVILYELLTGALPFMGESLGELFAAILETDPAPLRQHVPQVHPRLEEIVLRCLQRRPEHRFQTANELGQALAPFAAQAGYDPPMMNGGFITPGGRTQPFAGAVTPNGPHGLGPPTPRSQNALGPPTGPAPGATVPLGAVTPGGPMYQTNSAWQSTGGEPQPVARSKAPLILGLGLGSLAAMAAIAGLILLSGKPRAPEPAAAASAASVAPAPVPPLAPSGATAAAETASAPPAETAAPPTATAVAPTAKAAAAPGPRPHPKVEPRPPEPPPTARPKPSAAPTATGGGLQNAR